MNLLRELDLRDDAGNLRAVVESPGGSRVKLKYDPDTGVFAWSRLLVAGVRFPHDFGFFPQTLADDGDALDVILLASEHTYPGVVVPCRAVGALRIEQQRGNGPVKRNDRVIAVPAFDGVATDIADIADVPIRTRDELEAFTHASLALTGKKIKIRGWADAAEAGDIIAAAEAAVQRP